MHTLCMHLCRAPLTSREGREFLALFRDANYGQFDGPLIVPPISRLTELKYALKYVKSSRIFFQRYRVHIALGFCSAELGVLRKWEGFFSTRFSYKPLASGEAGQRVVAPPLHEVQAMIRECYEVDERRPPLVQFKFHGSIFRLRVLFKMVLMALKWYKQAVETCYAPGGSGFLEACASFKRARRD